MFDQLQEKLSGTLQSLRGKGKISEDNIQEALSEVKRSLLEADVNYRVVQSVVDSVREQTLGSRVLRNVDPGQQFTKAVHDELIRMMGENSQSALSLHADKPFTVLLMGLQGTGKTTSAAKLAYYAREEKGRKPLLIPADTSRPAAQAQLKQLAEDNGFFFYPHTETNALTAVKSGLQAVKDREVLGDFIVIDTAGRLNVDAELMSELQAIKAFVKPDLCVYVLDGMAGQSALEVASQFHTEVGFDAVLCSKLDGDARAGAVLSVKSILDVPVMFLGVGEKISELEPVHADRLASRILGMGDIVSLVEKARKHIDEGEARKAAEKLRNNQFTIDDFSDQMKSLKKMGGMESLLGMLPGGAKLKKSIPTGMPESEMKRMDAIISSMTPRERKNYKVIDGSRRRRIAQGSGTSVPEVNRFLKQFAQAKKMMSQFGKMGSKGFSRSNFMGMKPFG